MKIVDSVLTAGVVAALILSYSAIVVDQANTVLSLVTGAAFGALTVAFREAE